MSTWVKPAIKFVLATIGLVAILYYGLRVAVILILSSWHNWEDEMRDLQAQCDPELTYEQCFYWAEAKYEEENSWF